MKCNASLRLAREIASETHALLLDDLHNEVLFLNCSRGR